jgi:hypothetical protein
MQLPPQWTMRRERMRKMKMKRKMIRKSKMLRRIRNRWLPPDPDLERADPQHGLHQVAE